MNIYQIIKDELLDSLKLLCSRGILSHKSLEIDFSVEAPKEQALGEVSTNIALVLSKTEKKSPRDLAELLVRELSDNDKIERIEIAGPGFINFIIKNILWFEIIASCLEKGPNFASVNLGKGEKVNIEFVSANPTGPLHVGHMRGAIIGDVLANLLEFVGFSVTREYYINDAGSQIDYLTRSVYLRYLESNGEKVKFTEDLYPGDYLKNVGELIKTKYGNSLVGSCEKDYFEKVRPLAVAEMLKLIKDDLRSINIKMDNYFSEKSLYENRTIEKTLEFLANAGLVYQGTLPPPKGKMKEEWEEREQLLFRSTKFGDDVDRAFKKADGGWTYFAPDVAYHFDKISRGYKILIDVFGADHAGYVKRMKAAVSALSNETLDLEVKICQLVKLFKDGLPYKMSKRAGNFILLKDVINEVGADIARFVMLTRKNDAPLDFDFDKALEQSKDNPVFYVQYAHARASSILAKAETELDLEGSKKFSLKHFNLLLQMEERSLVRLIALWPKIVEAAAVKREPHRIAFYLNDLASCFHTLQHKGKINPEFRFIRVGQSDLSFARLSLVRATKSIISKGLLLLGINPVHRM